MQLIRIVDIRILWVFTGKIICQIDVVSSSDSSNLGSYTEFSNCKSRVLPSGKSNFTSAQAKREEKHSPAQNLFREQL